jgi:hypothetical protein
LQIGIVEAGGGQGGRVAADPPANEIQPQVKAGDVGWFNEGGCGGGMALGCFFVAGRQVGQGQHQQNSGSVTAFF